jgi:coenzyme F420-reducing hydrogenase gamma subunit
MSAGNGNHRPRIAFFDFTGCEGCQLTVVDSLQTHPELLSAVEIVQFREAMTEKDDTYHIAFIEGACTRPGDEDRLRAIRQQAGVVIALGACAHLGGVNALRDWQSLDEVRRYVYGSGGRLIASYEARPIEAVIQVDGFIPGCPIDRHEFVRLVTHLLQGRQPASPDHPVCVECKLNENICVYLRGDTCLGPITRAGCGAICPAHGAGCDGCRGLVPTPNLEWLRAVMAEHGITPADIDARLHLFLSYPIRHQEEQTHGR